MYTFLSPVLGVRGNGVARRTAGQPVERSILHQAHYSYQNSSSRLSLAHYSLTVQNRGPKQHSSLTLVYKWRSYFCTGLRCINNHWLGYIDGEPVLLYLIQWQLVVTKDDWHYAGNDLLILSHILAQALLYMRSLWFILELLTFVEGKVKNHYKHISIHILLWHNSCVNIAQRNL